MAINAPLLQTLTSNPAGDGLLAGVVPPAGGTYDHTQFWYVKMEAPRPAVPPVPASPWLDGGQFVGIQGVPGVHTIPGLDPGYYYQVIANAYSAADGNSVASLPRQALAQDETDPVIDRITQDLAATCNQITQANGYHTDVQEVARVRESGLITPSAYPFIVVQAMEDEANDAVPVEHISNNLVLVVEGWIKETATEYMDQDLNYFIADITRAVCADWRRSGNAITTKLLRWFKFTSEEVKPHGAVQVFFRVHYRHQRTNPARQV